MVKSYYGMASVTEKKMCLQRQGNWVEQEGCFRESTFGHGGLGVFGLEMCNKQVRIRFCNLGEGSGISVETWELFWFWYVDDHNSASIIIWVEILIIRHLENRDDIQSTDFVKAWCEKLNQF